MTEPTTSPDAASTPGAAGSTPPVSSGLALPSRVDPLLLAVASRQWGMLTTQQAHRCGLDRRDLAHLVATKALLHPGRGLYAVRALVDESPEGWHRHLAHGAALVHDDAVLTGVTAVLAHDVKIWGCHLDRPRITRPVDRGSTVRCFHVRPARHGAAVETAVGPAAPLPFALVQLAIDEGIESAVVSMDDALRSSKVTAAEISDVLAVVRWWPGSSRARSAFSFADGRRESVAESRCAVALLAAGIELLPQVEVRDERSHLIGRVDFLVAGTKVVVEVDGKVKYATGSPDVLWAEKRREDALRAAGYTVVRVTWADLERPGSVITKVRRAMAAAA